MRSGGTGKRLIQAGRREVAAKGEVGLRAEVKRGEKRVWRGGVVTATTCRRRILVCRFSQSCPLELREREREKACLR